MAPVDKFTVYAVIVGVVILIALLITLYQKISGGDDKKKRRPQAARAAAAAPAPAQGPPGVRRRGPRRGRMLIQRDDSGGEDEGEGEEEGMFEEFAQPEGKMGAKKLRKLQEKAEKKAAREAMEQEREEKKQRDAEIEARRKKEEEKRKIEEAAKEEEERLQRLEKERQEHEEYLKMKEMFSVDEEGQEDVAADLNSQSLLQEFINYIKATKVVMLEDLAAHFKLKTQDVIQRVQELQKEGQLTGVVDDRGKFIYITMEELESVAKFIRQHGRVSITELAKSSNSLVSLEPDPTLQRSYLASLRVGEEEAAS